MCQLNKTRKLQRTLLVVGCIVMATGQTLDLSCVHALGFHSGELETKATKLPVPKDAEVYYLGGGLGGGSVFRIKERSKPSYVLKRYRSPLSLENDLRATAIIREALAEFTQAPFDIVNMKRLPPPYENIVQLPDVEGWALNRNELAPLKPELDAMYEASVKELLGVIKRNYPQAIESDHHLLIMIDNKLVNVFIHPGNVVLDRRTKRMTIIDSH